MTPNERFEAVGDLYYRATGYLRPGKAEPLETGREANSDENRERFEQWLATRGFSDAIERIVVTEEQTRSLGDAADKLDAIRAWMKGRVAAHGEHEDARSVGFMDALSELEELL